MTFARGIFAFALLMLVAGVVGSRYIINSLFSSPQGPSLTLVADAHTPTPKPHHVHRPVQHHKLVKPPAARAVSATSVPTATVTPASPQPTATPLPPSPTVSIITPRKVHKHHAAPHPPTPTPTFLPTPTLVPTSTPTGILTLARYWVGSTTARRGQTVSVGYVIDNETGQTARLLLGASIKADTVLSWAGSSLSDPSHDVVAIVPPGVSTHIRYFSLPTHIRPGAYDIAWGLRDVSSGQRDALVAAPGALQILR